MAQSERTVGCYLAERLHEPDVEYWRSSTSQQELLSKPPHEAVFIDGPEQVVAYFQQLRPVPDAYRRYLPDASRVDRLPSYGGFGLLVLPVPLVSAEEGLTGQVQAVVRVAGPVWLAGAEEDTETRRRGDTESAAGRKIDGRKMAESAGAGMTSFCRPCFCRSFRHGALVQPLQGWRWARDH